MMSMSMKRQELITWKGKYQIPSMEWQVSHMHSYSNYTVHDQS